MYKKFFFEVIKLSACLLGVTSLYLSIVSLINLNISNFLYFTPINFAFIIWYNSNLNSKKFKILDFFNSKNL
tara:strand:+ start:253 stop:468 length:216 start_codon:yes stop_codon:yes gene_type:complete